MRILMVVLVVGWIVAAAVPVRAQITVVDFQTAPPGRTSTYSEGGYTITGTQVRIVEAGANRYLGAVRRHEIFDQLARMLSTHEAGAILALEVDQQDYSLSKLVYAIEQSDASILSIATEPSGERGPIRVTVKLDTHDITRIRHVLEHHGYHVVAAFSETDDDDALQDRIEEFMRYLEV